MDVITKFLDFLTVEKRVSSHTISSYTLDLKQFFLYYLQVSTSEQSIETLFLDLESEIKNIDIAIIEAPLIRTWMVELLENGISTKTVNRKISTLRSFFSYHLKIGTISDNPMLLISGPKNPKRLPNYVDESGMESLFSDNLFDDTFEGQRDKAILELFYATGIRVTELISLRINDINFYENSLKVLGKRDKERIIPFGQHLENILKEYLTKREDFFELLNQDDYLFVTSSSNKMYRKAVYRIVNKYLDMVTTIQKKSPHVLRHTFATHLLNKGADINVVKEILGHSSLAATQIYTHNTIEKLKSIYKQAHPRA